MSIHFSSKAKYTRSKLEFCLNIPEQYQELHSLHAAVMREES